MIDFVETSLMFEMEVLYGSETGTAEDVAEQIWQEARLLEQITTNVSSSLFVFICSTTGQGEEPSNMRQFWRSLAKRSVKGNFSTLNFAVLGLGDSSYERFNFAAKKLYRRFEQLGAHAIIPLGLADDQHDLGTDAVVDPWRKDLFDAVFQIGVYGISANQERLIKPNLSPSPRFSISFMNDCESRPTLPSNDLKSRFNNGFKDQEVISAKIAYNKRATTTDHFQETRLIGFDLSEYNISYEPGDVLMVQPQNVSETVDSFLELLRSFGHHNVDRVFFLWPRDSNIPINKTLTFLPQPCSLRDCATVLWDLNGVPRRSFFVTLERLSADELHKEKLRHLASTEGQQDLYDYCNRPRRNVLEVLQDFAASIGSLPLERLFDLLPVIRPRAFSIASNFKVHCSIVEILVAVVTYKTRLVRPRFGLCSTWLSRLQHGQQAYVWFRKGTIEFPTDPSSPCIMVGPGTGVAPFRNFIAGRAAEGLDGNVLFFGCRNRHKDFYFEDEWKECEKQNVLTILTAFSRDQDKKAYVQHQIIKCGRFVYRKLVEESGFFFVAGSAKEMPTAVKQALQEVLQIHGNLTPAESNEYIKALERRRRYQTETWS